MSRNRSYLTGRIGKGLYYTTEFTPLMKIFLGGLISYALFPTFTLVFGGIVAVFFIWLFIELERPIHVDPEKYTNDLVNRLSKLNINILLENTEAVKALLEKELTNRFDRHLGEIVRDGLERSYYFALATKNEELIKLLRPHAMVVYEEEYAEHLFNEKNTVNLKERLVARLEELHKLEEEERRALMLKYPFLQNVE